jgi:hypothetical protein
LSKDGLIRNVRIGLPGFLRNDEPLPPQSHRNIMDDRLFLRSHVTHEMKSEPLASRLLLGETAS